MTVIVRYVFRERLMHALSGLSYVYLLLTGLAFWTPALYWIAVVLGGGYLTRLLHPWVGLVFSAAVLWMYLTWRRDMRITPRLEVMQPPPKGTATFLLSKTVTSNGSRLSSGRTGVAASNSGKN